MSHVGGVEDDTADEAISAGGWKTATHAAGEPDDRHRDIGQRLRRWRSDRADRSEGRRRTVRAWVWVRSVHARGPWLSRAFSAPLRLGPDAYIIYYRAARKPGVQSTFWSRGGRTHRKSRVSRTHRAGVSRRLTRVKQHIFTYTLTYHSITGAVAFRHNRTAITDCLLAVWNTIAIGGRGPVVTMSRRRLALVCVTALAFGHRSEAFCGLRTAADGDDGGGGDFVSCLKAKAITTLDHVSRADSLPLTGSIALVRDDPHRRRQRSDGDDRTPETVFHVNERELRSKPDDVLDRMLYDKLIGIFSGRVVQIALPELTPDQLRMTLEEGNGRPFYIRN